MRSMLNQDLIEFHDRFSRSHERLKRDLFSSLSLLEAQQGQHAEAASHRHAIYTGAKLSFVWKGVLAAAAAVAIVAGVTFWTTGTPSVGVNQAWAAAVANIREVQTLHLRAETPSHPGKSGLELWWRRPGDSRMVFDNGMIITANGQVRCSYNAGTQTLTKSSAGQQGGGAVPVLDWFGLLFTSEDALSLGWTGESDAAPLTERVVYKGELCEKLVFEEDGRRREYIFDSQAHLIYEWSDWVTVERDGRSEDRMIYRVEVLDINQHMPEGLFTIEPTEGVAVIDRREQPAAASPAGP